MKVVIRIQPLKGLRFALRAFAEGALIDQDAAHVGDVVRRRNRMAARWAHAADAVEAEAVPWPPELRRPEDAR